MMSSESSREKSPGVTIALIKAGADVNRRSAEVRLLPICAAVLRPQKASASCTA